MARAVGTSPFSDAAGRVSGCAGNGDEKYVRHAVEIFFASTEMSWVSRILRRSCRVG